MRSPMSGSRPLSFTSQLSLNGSARIGSPDCHTALARSNLWPARMAPHRLRVGSCEVQMSSIKVRHGGTLALIGTVPWFSVALSSPTFISEWNVCPSGGLPYGIALDDNGSVLVANEYAGTLTKYHLRYVYVSDWGNSRIEKFTDGGVYVATLSGTMAPRTSRSRTMATFMSRTGPTVVSRYSANLPCPRTR